MNISNTILPYTFLIFVFFFLTGRYLITAWFVLLRVRGEKANIWTYIISMLIILPTSLLLFIALKGGLNMVILAILPLFVLPLFFALIFEPKDLLVKVDYSYRIGLYGLVIYFFKGIVINQGAKVPYSEISSDVSRQVFIEPRFCVPLVFNKESNSAKLDLLLFRISVIGFLTLILISIARAYLNKS